MTILWFELSAVVVTTRLEKMVRNEIEIPVDSSFFSADSTCVFGYIANTSARYQTFVANRLAIIHESRSSPSQWRHVSTQLNPTDDAFQGLSVHALLNSDRWLTGPNFLRMPEDC